MGEPISPVAEGTLPAYVFHENGHLTYYDADGNLKYLDDKTPCSEEERSCKACGLFKTPEGADGCIGMLPGVKFACCGHGVEQGYIYFENEKVVRFDTVQVEDHMGEAIYKIKTKDTL